MLYTKPQQRNSTKEKNAVSENRGDMKINKKVPDWIFENYRYYRSTGREGARDIEMTRLYEVANGIFNRESYNYVEDPFHVKDSKNKRYPARLRNYDIIRPIIERFLGERRERPNASTVYTRGSDTVTEFKRALNDRYIKTLQNQFVLEMQKLGYPVDATIKDTPNYKEIESETTLNWNDRFARNGQSALDILTDELDLKEQFQEAFYHWLVCGEVYDTKSVFFDDVEFGIVDPRDIIVYGWSAKSRFAEDAEAAIYYPKWTASSIVDYFGDKLSEDDIDWLYKMEDRLIGNSSRRFGDMRYQDEQGVVWANGRDDTKYLRLCHVVWKTLVKRGILYYVDPLGNTAKMPVDETYVLSPKDGDIKIEWRWENTVWEAWAVTDELHGDCSLSTVLFLDWGELLVQRTRLNNTSVCKLPYNGTYSGYDPDFPVSQVKKGLTYQELYNIGHYYFERTLAKNKDKLLLFPMGLIPEKAGWDEERWLYVMNAFSTIFYNEQSERAAIAIQGIKEIDMSLSQYMSKMWEFLRAIKAEWWDACGFNPQRYGDVSSSEGKGTMQQAVYRSAIASRDMVLQFEKYRETTEIALIDHSRYAWIKGKKGTYRMSDGQRKFIEINGLEHGTTEYGVFIKNVIDEYDNIQFMKANILQPLAQNGIGANIISDVVMADSMSRIRDLTEQGMKIQREYEEAKQQQILESQERVAGMELQKEQMKDKRERDLAQLRARTEIEKAFIMADSFNAQLGDTDNDNITESDEIYRNYLQRQTDQANLDEKRRSNMANEMLASEQNEIKREEMESKERIAKVNRNKYSK
jgi:hypothetical protein